MTENISKTDSPCPVCNHTKNHMIGQGAHFTAYWSCTKCGHHYQTALGDEIIAAMEESDRTAAFKAEHHYEKIERTELDGPPFDI